MNKNTQKGENKGAGKVGKTPRTRSTRAKPEAVATAKGPNKAEAPVAPKASSKVEKASTQHANGFKEGDEVVFGMPKGEQTRGTFSHRTAQGKLTIKTLEPRGKKKTWPPGTVVHWPAENVHRA